MSKRRLKAYCRFREEGDEATSIRCWITCWVCAGLGLQSPPKFVKFCSVFWISPLPLFIPKTFLWYYSHLWLGCYPNIYIRLGKFKEEHFTNTNQNVSTEELHLIFKFLCIGHCVLVGDIENDENIVILTTEVRLSQSTIICMFLFQTIIKGWSRREPKCCPYFLMNDLWDSSITFIDLTNLEPSWWDSRCIKAR